MASKLPRPGLKPSERIVRPGTSHLPTIRENAAGTSSSAHPSCPKLGLRRRSKSAVDLRRIPAEVSKAPLVRPGTKRPALANRNDEKKPKVAKVKIPDWDYKTRFQELLKKHTATQEENKNAKAKLAALTGLETEITRLKTTNEINLRKIDSLERDNQVHSQQLTDANVKIEQLERSLKNEVAELSCLKASYRKVLDENVAYSATLADYQSIKEKLKVTEDQVVTLKHKLTEHEETRRFLHNMVQDLKGNIRVFCRVRPPINSIEDDKQLCAIFFPNEATIEIKKSTDSKSAFSGRIMDSKQEFTFDKVFAPEAHQEEVFEELSQLVQSALDGYHVCVFAYGQTGSGKTYTMQGTLQDKGMTPRTIDLIFAKILDLQLSGWTFTVSASFLEIYNENIRDLLVPKSAYNYELRFNEGRGVTVTNLKIVPVSTAEELSRLMEEAAKNRQVAATDFNEHSSRSHAVTKINLDGYNETTGVAFQGSINLVDLAGSESAKTSHSSRLEETKNINKSLSTLGGVMMALHNKDPHVPYRNSKLTFLLQSCLGGNSKTLMFVNIAPFQECFSESVNSLRFAAKVKEIRIAARRNRNHLSPSSNT